MVNKITAPHLPQISMKGNGSQKTDARFIPEDYKNVAKGMEQQFAEYMLTQMNKTAEESEDEAQDSASQFYKNIQTTERAKAMTENQGGLGVQKVILDQIYPDRMRTEQNLNTYLKMREQNALHHKAIQAQKKAESQTIAMKEKEMPSLAKDIAKGDVK